jgi:hypothetical protein
VPVCIQYVCLIHAMHYRILTQLLAPKLVVLRAGLGDGATTSATFTYYPRCTALSTMYRDEPDALAATQSIVRNTGPGGATSRLQLLGSYLAWLAPWAYGLMHGVVFRALFLRPAERVGCQMLTVSDVIDQFHMR